ncbi:MAG: hypothetical protein ACTSQY_11735 [Candidatus Odinarchaeia archaeon]
MKETTKRFRNRRIDISSVRTANIIYALSENQAFYETNKAYEIWDESEKDFPRRTKEQEVLEQLRTILVHDVSSLLYEQVQQKHLVNSLFAQSIAKPGNKEIENTLKEIKGRMKILSSKMKLSLETIEKIDNSEFDIEEYLKKE